MHGPLYEHKLFTGMLYCWRSFPGHTVIQLDLSLFAEHDKLVVLDNEGGRKAKTPESQSTTVSAFQISALFCFGALRLICVFERTEPYFAAAAAHNPLAKVRKAAAGSLTHRHAWHRRVEPAQYVSGRNHQ